MAEDDWYGRFSRGRWIGYVLVLIGLTTIGLALAGFTFERQIIIDGVASPPSRWGPQIQWPPLIGGTLFIAYGVHLARRGHS